VKSFREKTSIKAQYCTQTRLFNSRRFQMSVYWKQKKSMCNFVDLRPPPGPPPPFESYTLFKWHPWEARNFNLQSLFIYHLDLWLVRPWNLPLALPLPNPETLIPSWQIWPSLIDLLAFSLSGYFRLMRFLCLWNISINNHGGRPISLILNFLLKSLWLIGVQQLHIFDLEKKLRSCLSFKIFCRWLWSCFYAGKTIKWSNFSCTTEAA